MSEFVRPSVKTAIPGEKSRLIVEKDDNYMITATKVFPIAIKKGKGIVLEDEDGNVFYDFTSGVGVCNTGHCHPKVVKAIKDQAEKLIHFAGTDYYYEPQAVLMERLAKLAPGPNKKRVFFTNSGTESVEAAIKLARYKTKRPQFLAFTGAFHGRTMGSLSLTSSRAVHKEGFQPTMPGVEHVPYAYCYRCPYNLEYPTCNMECVKYIEETVMKKLLSPNDVAAFFCEPIQGEGGYIVPPKEFLPMIKKLCEKYGILYVSDEVQAGFGRTGKFFACENFDVVPDIITCAKGMGSGMPIGCIIIDEKLNYPHKGCHSNTFGGNPVCCEAGNATLDVIEEENLLENAKNIGDFMHEGLKDIQKRHPLVGDVRGIGLMQAIEIVKDPKTKEIDPQSRDQICEEMLKLGLVTLDCGVSSIRFIPPLVITKKEMEVGLEIIEKAVAKVEKN
ncbi:MAG: acetyl ornithine aminotransferase family protein [Caldisericia bacterium]|nr:acetyl ornithine aminotransferase family protein [Caldisericia bacterium]